MALRKITTGNHLLDMLPDNEFKFVQSSSELVYLEHGFEVYRQDGPVQYVYFPKTVVFGLVVLSVDGKLIEGASIGNEGMVGLPIFLGVDFHPSQVVAQIPGEVLRMTSKAFMQAARPGMALDVLLRRYTLFRLRTAKQTGMCNTLHSAEERLCRWLLMMHDRTARSEFFLTHEFLSELLGLRRQTVSITAGTLQDAGLVTYRRGLIKVVDRNGLEATSCECYQYFKELLNRMFAKNPAVNGRTAHSTKATSYSRPTVDTTVSISRVFGNPPRLR